MNRRKQYLYNHQEYGIKAKTVDLWLKKYKPRELTIMIETYKKVFAIETKPKRRHRRSIRCVRMMALFGDKDNSRFTRIGKEIGRCKHGKWLYMPKRVRLEVDSPDNKAHRTGRRLSWRKGGAK